LPASLPREAVALERSTLADWVGGAAALLEPLVQALGRHVLAGGYLHGDDTPVPVLEPGRGKTRTARLWTYVRDERPWAGSGATAVLFRYSPDRKGEHPRAHLKSFAGVLHADGYAGFEGLYAAGGIREAACWAHVRRKFYDLHAATRSQVAAEALERIGMLYQIEASIRGQPAQARRAARQARAGPLLVELKAWMQQQLARVSAKSALALALRYALARWQALVAYCEDGRIEIDNNAAERALRAVALGRRNYLFAGSDAGGERARSRGVSAGGARAHRRSSRQPDRGAAAVAAGRGKRTGPASRGVRTPASASGGHTAWLPAIEEYVSDLKGQISVGAIGPIACAAVASDPHGMPVALVRQPGESVKELLERLDRHLRVALDHDEYTDEINPPLPSRR
jgi:hypothetical protein